MPGDDQKYGQKRLGRRHGTSPLPSRSPHKKIKETWKNKIKNNKQCSIIFKTCLNNNLLPKYTLSKKYIICKQIVFK